MNAIPLAAVLLGVAGGAYGLFADRLAARWPAHEDGATRRADWRTALVVLLASGAFAALPLRFASARDLGVEAAFFAALVVLLATDLDQRLLPDEITLPLVPAALVVLLIGWNPVLAGKDLGLASGLAAAVLAPAFLGVTGALFRGALGMGDLKLAVSLGLACGISQLVAGFVVASLAASVILSALLLTRRLGLRSAIPFGPILIVAAFLAVLRPIP
ncbi:MAG: A24 family peptidase [Chloroflexi bacterium]|nr:A24 family peptidase [Chloroflexota bacterium]